MRKILLIPKLINETGGPGSFQKRLIEYFKLKDLEFTFSLNETKPQSILLINGTKSIFKILKYKLLGVPIIHRLGSPATLQGYLNEQLKVKVRCFFIQKYLAFIRRFLANCIVYQSEFVEELWIEKHGKVNKKSKVIYNGTDFNFFKPSKVNYQSNKKYKIISVEGTQGNDPFDIVLNIGKELSKRRNDFEILLIGKLSQDIEVKCKGLDYVKLIGRVPQEKLPNYYSCGNLYLLTDIIQAGCPNSAIEAMACGLPVIAYNVGPITELIHDQYSKLIDVENDPWHGLNPSNFDVMADEIENIFFNENQINHQEIINNAKQRYSLEVMAEQYLSILIDN